MKKYQKHAGAYFIGALVFILISTMFTVVLQFFKGDMLDYVITGNTQAALRYATLLAAFILSEILFYFGYRQFSARFVVGCTKPPKRNIFENIFKRGYADYKSTPQGEYIAKYTNEADTIKARRFQLLPLFWEILFKIIFVSIALFMLDWRLALITIGLLTTPLYVPRLIEKRLQNAQNAYPKAVKANLAKVNDWFSGFEIKKPVLKNLTSTFKRKKAGAISSKGPADGGKPPPSTCCFVTMT